jgi:hypothetical protein
MFSLFRSASISREGLESRAECDEVRRALFETQPIEVRHHEVNLPNVNESIAKFGSLEENIWAFRYFSGFAEKINNIFRSSEENGSGPWRLQLYKSAELSLPYGAMEGPTYGLRFQVYYNSMPVGEIELFPKSHWRDGFPEALPNLHPVTLLAEINYAPMLPYDHLFGLFWECCLQIPHHLKSDHERIFGETFRNSLMFTLWESNRKGSKFESFGFQHDGFVELSV